MIKNLIRLNLIYLLVIPLSNLSHFFPKSEIGALSLPILLIFVPAYGVSGLFGITRYAWVLGILISMIAISLIFFLLQQKLNTSKKLVYICIALYFISVFAFNLSQIPDSL